MGNLVGIMLVGSAAAADNIALVPQHFEPDVPLALCGVFAAVEVNSSIDERAAIKISFACLRFRHVRALVSARA